MMCTAAAATAVATSMAMAFAAARTGWAAAYRSGCCAEKASALVGALDAAAAGFALNLIHFSMGNQAVEDSAAGFATKL